MVPEQDRGEAPFYKQIDGAAGEGFRDFTYEWCYQQQVAQPRIGPANQYLIYFWRECLIRFWNGAIAADTFGNGAHEFAPDCIDVL